MEYEFNTREDLTLWFDSLVHAYTQMNQLPHEMAQWMIPIVARNDEEKLEQLNFWASYLEHLASLVRSLELKDLQKSLVRNQSETSERSD